MTEKALQGFVEMLVRDEKVRLEAGDAIATIAVKHGFECTAQECAAMFRIAGGASGELSEEALAGVAGGMGTSVISHSIGIRGSESYPTSMTGGSLNKEFGKR